MGTESAESWDRRYAAAAEDGVWAHSAPKAITEVVTPLPPGRALDLGCGEGRVTRLLLGLGWTVTAVDFSAEALAIARRLLPGPANRVKWVQAEVRTLPMDPGQDLVVAGYLHLDAADLRRVIAAAGRALAPGGTLVVLGHDVENLAGGAPGPRDPSVLYTPELLAEAAAGLTIERCERLVRGADDPETHGGDAAPAVDTLLVARRPA
ncbi:MAG: class I SAM-dependent methyltransferase [Amnibacterium sp.]